MDFRLLLLSFDFRQLLQGQFHSFLPLSRITRQLSVFWSKCTIPHQRFSYQWINITIFDQTCQGFFPFPSRMLLAFLLRGARHASHDIFFCAPLQSAGGYFFFQYSKKEKIWNVDCARQQKRQRYSDGSKFPSWDLCLVSAAERCLSSEAASSSERRIIDGTNRTGNDACHGFCLFRPALYTLLYSHFYTFHTLTKISVRAFGEFVRLHIQKFSSPALSHPESSVLFHGR